MGLSDRLRGAMGEVMPGMKQPKRRNSRPNPWPRCIPCARRVPELCPECSWCHGCCVGHKEDR